MPHPTGEWLIKAGGLRCAVESDLGRALLPLQGQAPGRREIQRQLEQEGWTGGRGEEAARLLADLLSSRGRQGKGPGQRAIGLRLPLIPAWLASAVARRLVSLAWWPIMGAMAFTGLGLYLVGGTRTGWPQAAAESPLLPGLAVFLLTALWHELGHAAALSREGYSPGRIGLGLLFVVPVLYTDVSAVGALPRAGRLRVDLAGVCFQLGAGGWLFAAGACNPEWPASGALRLGGLLALPAVAWSLLPFIRADGYWFTADLLGLADLERPAPGGAGRWLKIFLILHRTGHGVFFLAIGLAVPLRLHRWLEWAAVRWGLPGWLPAAVVAVFSLVVWWRLVNRLLMLWSASRTDLSHR